jgi:hypothetical protein
MGEYLDQIPEKLHAHLREITRTSGLPESEESVETMAKGWLEKEEAFNRKLQEMDMEEVQSLTADDEHGALAMTYSGSLVLIGPLVDGARKAQYVSIGMRRDVPDVVDKEGSVLAREVEEDQTIEFQVGPVRSTSKVYKIALLTGELSPEEQEEKMTEATQVISQKFLEVNRTIVEQE